LKLNRREFFLLWKFFLIGDGNFSKFTYDKKKDIIHIVTGKISIQMAKVLILKEAFLRKNGCLNK